VWSTFNFYIQTRYEKELEKAQSMLDRYSGIQNKNTRNKKVIPRADTAEERAKREVLKAESFRKREEKRSKKGNRARAGNIHTLLYVILYNYLVGSEGAQAKAAKAKNESIGTKEKKKPKSGFAKDLADVSNKNVKKHRYVANKDRKEGTKGRGALAKGTKVPKKGGKVSKTNGKRKR